MKRVLLALLACIALTFGGFYVLNEVIKPDGHYLWWEGPLGIWTTAVMLASGCYVIVEVVDFVD